LKQQSIDATEIWKIAGKPRSGTVNSNRIRIKLSYKNAIKEAALNADSNFNDDLYNRLCQKDNIGVWKAWRKRFCMQNAKPTGILNGKNGDENVRNEFTNYYENVFRRDECRSEIMYKGEIESLLDADQQAGELPVIDCHCLQACISHLKYRKASGYDGKYEPSTTS